MGKKSRYLHWFRKNIFSSINMRLFRKAKTVGKWKGEKGPSLEETSEALCHAIDSGLPFAAIHFGATELSCLNNHEKIELGFKSNYKPSVVYSMKNNAGFFPADQAHLKRYGDTLIPLLKEATFLGIMGLHMEEYFQEIYCPDSKILLYEGIEPLRGDWSSHLQGKKVLVVSPFSEQIREQYAKREKLFPKGSNILPEFTLLTIDSPLTCADETMKDSDFFQELEKMKKAMATCDFDIALVGAGAYGNFLVLEAKRLGKQGIQTGGATSTLFGMIGKRWDKREHVAKYVNPSWTRPSKKPAGYEKIEGGAYW